MRSLALKTAVFIWKQGNEIDLILQTKLLSEGYDVAKLERRYRA
ncbi:hypothetical protein [Neorhizobium sp. S3-V5DH]|nr:hypothetical protein [Neorhizobium sp. S3-V5DH]TCV62331.1 hypothetical protein EDE09_12496 [Neorhizobium sp. S3-V5DH]